MSASITATDATNIFSPPGAGRVEAVLGVSQTYKAEASQTNGQLVCTEIIVPPGQGIPPHRHSDEDEAFYVLAGRVVITGDNCDGGEVRLDPDSFFYGPRAHAAGCTASAARGPRMPNY